MQVLVKGPSRTSGYDCEASAEGGRITISEGKLRSGASIFQVPETHYDLVDRNVGVTLHIYLAVNSQDGAEVLVDEILDDGVDEGYRGWRADGLKNGGCIVEAYIPPHVTDISGLTMFIAHHYNKERLKLEEQDGGSEE
jgi:hypothetical protein